MHTKLDGAAKAVKCAVDLWRAEILAELNRSYVISPTIFLKVYILQCTVTPLLPRPNMQYYGL